MKKLIVVIGILIFCFSLLQVAAFAKPNKPENVINVAASGADFTDPIAAMESITDASASNPYLVKIGPGIYDLGDNGLYMKEYVDIEGSGENVTVITSTHSNGTYEESSTIYGADHCELRFITVENQGGSTYSVAIYNSSASPKITHVTATASGGTDNYGVSIINGSSTIMFNVTVNASGGNRSYGIYVITDYGDPDASVVMTNVTVTTNTPSAGQHSKGIVVYGEFSTATLTDVTLTISGGLFTSGVSNSEGAKVYMSNVDIIATGENNTSGVSTGGNGAVTTMNNVTVKAIGGTRNRGVFNGWANNTSITNSTITAEQYSIEVDSSHVMVGHTMLEPGVKDDYSDMRCIGAYTSSFTPLDSGCQ